jgi:uncharacterized protein involved in cysteine biosynthesis
VAKAAREQDQGVGSAASSTGLAAFRAGFAAVPSALGSLVRHPAWLRLALLAGAVQLGVAVLLAVWTASRADDILGAVVTRPDGGIGGVVWVAAWLVVAGASLAMGLVVGMGLGGAAASPVYDRLIDHVEASEGVHRADQGGGVLAAVRGVATGLGHALAYLALWAVMAVAAMSLNVVPLLGQVAAAAAGFVVSAFTLALQATDGAASRRDATFGAKLARARRHGAAWVGLGAGMAALALVPVVSLLAAPAAVVAGTRLVCALERESSKRA